MRRRTVIAAAGSSVAMLAGCSSLGGCHGVTLGIGLFEPTTDAARLELDELDLTDRDRTILRESKGSLISACTRNNDERSLAITTLVDTVATAAGYDDEDLYYSNKTVEEPVKFEDGPYRARLLFDTAE